jgi:hypothetical protein
VLYDPGFDCRGIVRDFSSQKRADPLWGPPSLLFNGCRWLFTRRKAVGVDGSPPSIAEVKNEWSYTSTPLYAFVESIGVTLTLYSDL